MPHRWLGTGLFAVLLLFGATATAAQEAASVAAHPVSGTTHPVAARDLARGEILAANDIVRVADAGGDPASAPGSLIGWTTRRVISAGEALRPPAVAPPDLVRGGDPVQAIWTRGTIELRLTGTASGSAALGDRVLVRVDARRRVEGVVIGPGLVQLNSSLPNR